LLADARMVTETPRARLAAPGFAGRDAATNDGENE